MNHSIDDYQNIIHYEIKNNNVLLFMKGTKDQPMCGFSGAVVKILNSFGIEFKTIDVLESHSLREEIKKYSDWPTLPQLYINGEFIGGHDIVRELYGNGDLKKKIEDPKTKK